MQWKLLFISLDSREYAALQVTFSFQLSEASDKLFELASDYHMHKTCLKVKHAQTSLKPLTHFTKQLLNLLHRNFSLLSHSFSFSVVNKFKSSNIYHFYFVLEVFQKWIKVVKYQIGGVWFKDLWQNQIIDHDKW